MNARTFLAAAGLLASLASAWAYPPAPHHTIYGLVRDEMGHPLMVSNAVVILETLSGVRIQKAISPQLAVGVNYRLLVPMDAGLTDDLYRPTAMQPTLPFRLKVMIGGVTYLPMEMSVSAANLGQPAEMTRIDLTLGEDVDRDGLPDAWERQLLGAGMTIHDIHPDADSDGDGVSNYQEYLAGTYAHDPSDALKLEISRVDGRTCVQFLAIAGRNYSLNSSTNLSSWAPISFRVVSEGPLAPGPVAPVCSVYRATEVRPVRLEVVVDEAHPPAQLFLRAQLQ